MRAVSMQKRRMLSSFIATVLSDDNLVEELRTKGYTLVEIARLAALGEELVEHDTNPQGSGLDIQREAPSQPR